MRFWLKHTEEKYLFSIGYLARSLLAAGLSEENAYKDASGIAIIIQSQGKNLYTSDEIMEITEKWYEEMNTLIAQRIRVMRRDLEPIKPMVVLLGGVTGIGKSTLAQMFSARLGIKSIFGTDLIREVMRVTISKDIMPALHASSYIAHQTLDTTFLPAMAESVVGFEEQARSVIVGIQAGIEQAINDNEIHIMEGIHLVPGLISKKIMHHPNVIAFQLVLNDEQTHQSRLNIRETKQKYRGTNYSEFFEEIREIQGYLIRQAEINKVEIVDVEDIEKALLFIINRVWEFAIPQSNT